jgi:hypothetical protein
VRERTKVQTEIEKYLCSAPGASSGLRVKARTQVNRKGKSKALDGNDPVALAQDVRRWETRYREAVDTKKGTVTTLMLESFSDVPNDS